MGNSLMLIWPQPVEATSPKHLPAEVESAFTEAQHARIAAKMNTLAVFGYCRTLELAIKAKKPELKGSLYDRIESLAASNDITPDLKAWAHDIRMIRKDAAHDDANYTDAEVLELSEFTDMVLRYMFTLPETVRLRGEKPQA
jgi:hypothetical protein